MSASTTTNAGTWRERLTELLEQQRSAVTQLKELAEQQEGHIREGRSEALLTLLSRRQVLIDEFLDTHNRMQSLLTDVGEQIEQLSAADRDAIRATIDEINALLGEVLQRDEQDRRFLEEARGNIRSELKTMTNGRQARSAYLGNSNNPAASNRFADEQG